MSNTNTKRTRKKSRSGKTTFRPRARLLRILGEELISDDVVAITELVKNAHDADASRVTISFEGVTGPDGRIIVQDDGDGMDLDTLLHCWMEPASSGKGRGRVRRTRKGRRMLGEKGVGRFAVDKLGSRLELVTRKNRQKDELHAWFDWDEYSDDSRMLSEVENRWELSRPTMIKRHGTALIMSGLRTPWTEKTFRRMCTRLSRLISPHEGDQGFTINIQTDEFPDYSQTLGNGFLDRAPYHIEANFDGAHVVMKVKGKRATTYPWNGREDLTCGAVNIRISAFDLETESLSRIGPRMEARAWLKHWAGVSIYRDGFRIWPYGEPHDDWLRLDQRRVNNPVVRLSNNQIVGFVHITADDNPELRDQTNREGLVNNRQLEDLRRLVYFVLQVLEAERQTIRHPDRKERRSPGRVRLDEPNTLAEEIEKLAGEAGARLSTRMKALAKRARIHAEREEAGRLQVVDGLVELAAAGQAAGEVHDFVNPLLKSIEDQIGELARANGRNNGTGAALRIMQRDLTKMRSRLSLVEPLSQAITHRRHSIDVPREIENYLQLIDPVLEHAGVVVKLDLPRQGLLRSIIRPQTFHRLLYVLTTNSLDWIGGVARPRIQIRLEGQEKTCQLMFRDNGPGIPGEYADQIFDPLTSLKEGGKGMGLTIARRIAEQHLGTIELVQDGRMKGAAFMITLPRQRKRS